MEKVLYYVGFDVEQERRKFEEWCDGDRMIQGFTDQYGNFLTREEAYPIAKAAGQIIREDHCPGTLYSECYI